MHANTDAKCSLRLSLVCASHEAAKEMFQEHDVEHSGCRLFLEMSFSSNASSGGHLGGLTCHKRLFWPGLQLYLQCCAGAFECWGWLSGFGG